MLKEIRKIPKRIIMRIRGELTIERLVSMGMVVGENFHCLQGTMLDPAHCWLIEIGDNVTLAPGVHILCHDASTKNYLGYTKIGRVTIGDNVFIGDRSIVLPGVTIGNNVIVGANSTVTSDIPDGMVYVGSPARRYCTTEDYIRKERIRMSSSICYDDSWTLRKNVSKEKRMQQKSELVNGSIGYID